MKLYAVDNDNVYNSTARVYKASSAFDAAMQHVDYCQYSGAGEFLKQCFVAEMPSDGNEAKHSNHRVFGVKWLPMVAMQQWVDEEGDVVWHTL